MDSQYHWKKIVKNFFEDYEGIGDKNIAGVVMFDALMHVLWAAEASRHLTALQRVAVLRQVAQQASQIADRYSLDHYIDLDAYINRAKEAVEEQQ